METLGACVWKQKRKKRQSNGSTDESIELFPNVSIWKFNPLVDANA